MQQSQQQGHDGRIAYRCCVGVLRSFSLVVLGIIGCSRAITPSSTISSNTQVDLATPPAPVTQPTLNYATHDLPGSIVHTVTIPPETDYRVDVALAETLSPLSVLAEEAGAIAAINAGFFDPQNGLTTSYVTIQNQLVADPTQNLRLIENPDLTPYLDAILDRSEFRIYDCVDGVQYDITRHSTPIPSNCVLVGSVGAGPQLLPQVTGYEEGFLANNSQGEVVRDAVGSRYPNARSAVGLKADGSVVLVMVSQRSDVAAPTGLSFDDLAGFLQELDVISALNLDGGSSSGLFFQGEAFYGRLDAENRPVERSIKSILLVR